MLSDDEIRPDWERLDALLQNRLCHEAVGWQLIAMPADLVDALPEEWMGASHPPGEPYGDFFFRPPGHKQGGRVLRPEVVAFIKGECEPLASMATLKSDDDD